MFTLERQFIGRNILVIDDDEALRGTVVELLTFAGLHVVACSNAPLGLQLADTQPFDLILTDLMMPEMDGYTLMAALKQNPRTATIPVIVATGKADPADQEESIQRGACAYLVKPFRIETLLRAVQTCLRSATEAK